MSEQAVPTPSATTPTDTPDRPFQLGDTVRWCWTGENATGEWFTARLTAYRPAEFPSGWAAELVDPGTFYGGTDPGWGLPAGETVFVDEPSMTLVAAVSR